MYFDELSNDEWALVSALVSEGEVREHRRGRPRAHPRTIVNAVLWILSTGETWSKLPSHYPTVPTCRRRFNDWQMNGTLIEMVTRLAERGRSFAITPTPPAAVPERPAQAVYECDRLRGVFWQNPESWNDPKARDGASEGFLTVPRRLAEARDVVRANAPTPVSSSRAALPMGSRSEHREHDAQPMVSDSSFTPVHDGRGYSIYAIARPVAGGMFRGWAEIIKEGRRVERSGLIGPRYGTVEEAAAYALEWSHNWIAAQPTQVQVAQVGAPVEEAQAAQQAATPAALAQPAQPVSSEPRHSSDIVRTPNDMNRPELNRAHVERNEFRYADLQG
jgi:transposase